MKGKNIAYYKSNRGQWELKALQLHKKKHYLKDA